MKFHWFLVAFLLMSCNEATERDIPSPAQSEVPAQEIPTVTGGAWNPYPACAKESTQEATEHSSKGLASCLTQERFHVDGPALLRLVTDYVCSDFDARPSYELDVNPPLLASALYAIAFEKLQSSDLPIADREHVQPSVDGYSKALREGDEMYHQLLRHSVSLLEGAEGGVLEHAPTARILGAISIPENCNHQGSEPETSALIAIASEAIQRFSQLHWRRATDMIARANKIADVDAAGLAIPSFVLSYSAADTVARVYGFVPPGNGTYPDTMVDIDISTTNYNYSRFAVPIAALPPAALGHLGTQSAAISAQIGNVIDLLEDTSTGSRETTIYVPAPESVEVFSPEFWVEHVIWQIAYREVLLDEDLSLDPDSYSTYGLH